MRDVGKSGSAILRAVVPVLVIAAVSLVWVVCLPRAIVVGDDLGMVTYLEHVTWPAAFVDVFGDSGAKFRPVLQLLIRVIVPAFGANMYAYVVLNVLVQIASALTLASIVSALTGRNVLLETLSGCAFVFSRFAYYNVLQIYGIMEGLALLFLLLALRSVVTAYRDPDARGLRAAIWFGALAILTDERYLAALPFLIAAPLLCPAPRPQRRTMIRLAVANCVLPVAYVAAKVFWFKDPIAVGTGGRNIGFDPYSVLTFLRTAVANMLGFNAGDAYFSGADLTDVGAPAYILGALVCLPLLLVMGWYARDVIRRRVPVVPFALGLMLFVPMLLTSTVTFRLEFRWLYVSFALVVIGLTAVAGRSGPRSIAAGLAAFALTASIGGAVYYRQFAPNVYFIHDMAVGASLRDEMVRDPAERIVLAVHHDRSFAGWAFQQNLFFRTYGLDGFRVRYVNEPEEAVNEVGRVAVLSVQMTEAGVTRVEIPRVAVVPFYDRRLSFEASFANGVINSTRATRTPGGRGVFLFPYAGEPTGASSITVLPGFRYTFRKITILPNEHLMFYLAQPLTTGAPSRAYVSVRAARGPVDVFSVIVPPAAGEPQWGRQDVELRRFAGRSVDVIFGADPTTADESAWVAFAEPSLVVRPR